MAEEKEYGLLIAAIVAIVSIVGLVILFSRGAPVGKVVAGSPAVWDNLPRQYNNLDPGECVEDSGCSSGWRCKESGTWKCWGTAGSPVPTIETDSGYIWS